MKPILINGFPRSGTTFLYFLIYEKYSKKVLYEPLNLQVLQWIKQYKKYKDIEKHLKEKTHPYFKDKIIKIIESYIENFNPLDLVNIYLKYYPGGGFIKDIEKLKKFLEFFKDFSIKEVSLHFYLNESFIKENWEVYHIIRHPVDTFMSWIKSALPSDKINYKFYKLLQKLEVLKRFHLKIWKLWYDPQVFYLLAKSPETLEERFIALWTITNYLAIKSLTEDHIIVYERLKTYKGLPFKIKENELKIKIYPEAREKYENLFEKIAENLGIEEEYNYLLKLFK